MNSAAHEQCGEWIARKFHDYGMQVTLQRADLQGYDGTVLKSTNIIAKSQKQTTGPRILICAHWDSRPWADNDPDSANWHKPVMAANDGASGVAVMLEIARLLQENDSASMAVDFICFDAEDWGIPQWENDGDADSWALGAQYWAANCQKPIANSYQYGILLDMVGGQSARFYQEYFSMKYARNIVEKVWQAASAAGYGSYFPAKDGGGVTDDHLPVNEKAGIPCIDIINHYPDCEQSNFGPTWHTINDDMQHIDKNTLQAVGQTLIQLLFS
jgi:Zn-dependent M28 family amino/carboxypeptidase